MSWRSWSWHSPSARRANLAWMQPDEIAAAKPAREATVPPQPASKSLGLALLALAAFSILLAAGILAVGWPWPTVNVAEPLPPSPFLLPAAGVFGGGAVLLGILGAVTLVRARKAAAEPDLPHQATAPEQGIV